ncbi:uncharacterized protein FIESC28_07709 [Fusarium coffeatum]|uniref:Uncharacterized protein n=1 Tax=Fusarium coffeatum TaxID=231269 RepID=A0A366RBF2_9HYPO|nr:uncharacterized protein FIESC28_07709 [Fusarium coffeatum]RBR14473.1 hypothetical protein FIESC28_07709 [Fusarium coffeatum]
MAPITALIDKSTAGGKVTNLFYCMGKAQLGLALWSGTEDADPEEPIQPPTEIGEGQHITNPSQIPFKVTDKDKRNLSEVSPYQKLGEVDIGHTTLTSCSVVITLGPTKLRRYSGTELGVE